MTPKGLDLIWTLAPLVVRFTPLSSFKTHILTQFFLLSCVSVLVFFISSWFLRTNVLEIYSMCFPTQGQVVELFFFRHIIKLYNSRTKPYNISSLWWNESLLTTTCPSRFAAPSGHICPAHPGRIPFPPSGNKLHKPPYFFLMPSRSPRGHISHTAVQIWTIVLQFIRGQEMLSKSILDRLCKRNESEMTIASALRGRLTCSIWRLRFEGLLPLLREVVTDCSGFGL